jgi:two-component system LytT family response regulator
MIRTQELNRTNNKLLNPNFGVLVALCVVLYGLAIFKDYIFSEVYSIGFYWSDTMLYNIYWLLFIPFMPFANFIYKKVQFKSLTNKILYASSTGFIFSVLHIFIFTSIFILGSNLIYSVPHRFLTILKNAISNQLHVTIIAYLFSPLVFEYLKRKIHTQISNVNNIITIKNGTRRIKIDISTILFIKSDKPYTKIHSTSQNILHNESLKNLESILDSQIFLRVHRSVIINKNHITELKSRKNGDYDGVLTNGQSVRFSRHYRQNWSELLNH